MAESGDADVVVRNRKETLVRGLKRRAFCVAMILFVTIVLYYFINFKYLSTIWAVLRNRMTEGASHLPVPENEIR